MQMRKDELAWLGSLAIPLLIMLCCGVSDMATVIVQSASGPVPSIASMGRISALDFLYILFGSFALFGGIALFLVAFACRQMGLGGYAQMRWFALFSVFGGLWTIFDPTFVLKLVPYPEFVCTLSALCQHGMVVAFFGYAHLSVGVFGRRGVAAFFWVEAILLVLESLLQFSGGLTLFDLSAVSLAVHVVFTIVVCIALGFDIARQHISPKECAVLLVWVPCAVGLLVEAASYYSGIGADAPWFGTGFVITVGAQLGTIMYFVKSQSEAAGHAHELELELEKSKTAIMLSQIQPHFLYNALNTIQYLCETNPKVAAKTINHFARYLRGNMDSLTQDVPIPLQRDLEHLDNYLAIEKLRFPQVNIVFDIDDLDFSVPALTLQPLVENAIRHGLNHKDDGGTVTISSWEEPDAHCISVVDTGVGFDASKFETQETEEDALRSHVGLRNTSNRLAWMCGGRLEVSSVLNEGTAVTLRIPKERAQDSVLIPEQAPDREDILGRFQEPQA